MEASAPAAKKRKVESDDDERQVVDDKTSESPVEEAEAKPGLQVLNGYSVPASCSSETLHLARVNAHPRDREIAFDEGPHVYYVRGRTGFTSVTTVIHERFEHFDAASQARKLVSREDFPAGAKYLAKYGDLMRVLEQRLGREPTVEEKAERVLESWEKNREECAELGTLMHRNIELFYNGVPVVDESPEYAHHFFQNYRVRQEAAGYTPFRTEWTLWDEDLMITGSIDMVFQKTDPQTGKTTYHMVDWKRSREIRFHGFGKFGAPPLDKLKDCNYEHYSLQLNLYKFILKKSYGIDVEDMHIVVFHPDNDNFEEHKVRDLQETIREMLQHRVQDGLVGKPCADWYQNTTQK